MTPEQGKPATQAAPPVQSSYSQNVEKIWDVFWRTVSDLFRFSYSAEIFIDAEGRNAGEWLFEKYFSGEKSSVIGFSKEDAGELVCLCGKAAYFGIPSLALIYYLNFLGAVIDLSGFIAYFYSRSRYVREEEKKEMQKIEELVEKGKTTTTQI